MSCLRLVSMARSNLINWTAWSSLDMCVNWNEPLVSRLQLYEQPSCALNDELVDANGVCQGIQKVRVGPATRSAVATCNNINNLIKKPPRSQERATKILTTPS